MSVKRAAACIKKHKSFLITAHTNLEGDALGSELAFYRLLNKLGKKATVINQDDLPYEYNFLPGRQYIRKLGNNMKAINFDCFVALDCSDLGRTGRVHMINSKNKPVLNIDHHISNNNFGDINWVEPKASSCSEMIYKLYRKMHVSIDKDAAICLYTGMLTDTGSFRYTNTRDFTHKAVSELLKTGIDIAKIYRNIYENMPYQDMRLLTEILPYLKRDKHGKIVWVQVRRSQFKNRKPSFDLSESILSFARAIKGVEVAVLIKEGQGTKNEIRVNFRSKGKIDVNKIASFFGGGGHKTASGATIRGKINEVSRAVLSKVRSCIK